MANINQGWRKWIAVSCNHGPMADPVALQAVLSFKKTFKPHVTLHLGDFCDFAALRSGAKGSKDEGVSIQDDIHAGTSFLEALEPNVIFDGNHETRIYKLLDHPNATVSYAASQLVGELNDLATKLKAPARSLRH